MKTDEQIRAAYEVAHRLAKSVLKRMKTNRASIFDEDDLVQEGMVAWLEDRNMYYSMIRAIRDSSVLSRYAYDVKGLHDPFVTSLDDTDISATAEDTQDWMASVIDATAAWKRVMEIKNDDARFAVLSYTLDIMSLRELGRVFEKSHEWVRTFLIEPELKKIREEFGC